MTRKIFLADESLIVYRTVEHILSGREYELDFVGSGDRALDAIRASVPEVVLAAVDLAGIDGYTLSEIVKGDPDLKDTRVILLVPKVIGLDEKKFRESRADTYIIKPFEPSDFLGTIEKHITPAGRFAGQGVSPEVKESDMNREEMIRELFYEAIPEMEEAIIAELKSAIQRSVEDRIPYIIEKVITERLEKRKKKSGQDQAGS